MVLNICNLYTSAIPKVGMHLGIIGLHPLHSLPFVKVCFTPKYTFGFMGLYISHLVTNPMLGLQHIDFLGFCEFITICSLFVFLFRL
jgi:hypothetical protein